MKRLLYLSYPIDNAMLSESQVGEINRAKAFLLGHDLDPAAAVFDPGDAFMVRKGSDPGHEISSINMHALDTSEGVLAFLPRGIASVGVPMEIAHAGMAGKPVAVVSDAYSWALQLPRDNVAIFPEGQADAAMEWLLAFEGWEPVDQDIMPVVVQKAGLMPTRSHADDAGLDLYVLEDTVLPWGEFVDVRCGVNLELPNWAFGLLVGRSSTFRRKKIEVQPGIIDAGYRGEMFAACIWRPAGWSQDESQVTVKAGERLAQLILIPNGTKDVQLVESSALTEHPRGLNGFGSSGD